MTTLTEKVLSSFEKPKGNSVPYYATNTESHVEELNLTIIELGEQGIYPQLVNLTEDIIELNFIKVLNGQRKYKVKVDTGKEEFDLFVNGDTKIFTNNITK